MKHLSKQLTIIGFILCTAFRLHSQGYIVPNGVVTNLFVGEIDVWNPGTQVTGFSLIPAGKQSPSFYTNVFTFMEPVTIGVRVFLVSPNDAISLQPIQAQNWAELGNSPSYVFANGVPFYVGLYTGAQIAPPYPPYPPYLYLDAVFGWAELVNNGRVIQVLDSAVEYGGAGIYAGTRTIIPVPEPSVFGLVSVAFILFVRERLRPEPRACTRRQ